MIKILYINEHIETNVRGGDMVQMVNTKEYIEKEYSDIQIDLCTALSNIELIKKYDIIHIFNMQTADYTYKAIRIAKSNGIPIYLSTIYWNLLDSTYISNSFKILSLTPSKSMEKVRKVGFLANKLLYKIFKNKSNIMYNKKKIANKILLLADCLLPNSNEELLEISKHYDIDYELLKRKSVIVPNAIDVDKIASMTQNKSCDLYIKNYVLEVAALNPVKNQIQVVKALFDVDVPIVFIGRTKDKKYYDKLKKISDKRGNVHFINEISNEDVFKYYEHALCHVLPSFRESPGLSTLEALSVGTPVVVANETYCPIHYYQFDKYAYMCNPYDKLSLKENVLKLIDKEKLPKVNEEYLIEYSYYNVAKITYSAYINVNRYMENYHG